MGPTKFNVYSLPVWGCFISSSWIQKCNDNLYPIIRELSDCQEEHDYAIFLISGEITPNKVALLRKKMALVKKRSWVIAYGYGPLKKYRGVDKSTLEELTNVDFYIPYFTEKNSQKFRNAFFPILKKIEEQHG